MQDIYAGSRSQICGTIDMLGGFSLPFYSIDLSGVRSVTPRTRLVAFEETPQGAVD